MSRQPTGAATLQDTQMLPTPTGTGRHREPAAEPGWLQQWRISLISGAVIVATILAVVVALLAAPGDPPAGPTIETATESGPPTAAATPEPATQETPAPSPGPTRAASVEPVDRLAAFAIAVQQQVNTRNLDAEAGRGLLQAVKEIARRLDKGHNNKAAQSLITLDERLAELREEGALSPAGFAALDTLGPIISALRERD